MPSATMMEIALRHKQEEEAIDEQLAQERSKKSATSKEPQPSDSQPDEPEEVPDADTVQLDDSGFDDTDDDEADDYAGNDQPDDEADEADEDDEPDYKNKFERLKGKTSKIESDKSKLEKENARLQAIIDAGNSGSTVQPSQTRTSNKPAVNTAVTDQEVDDYLNKTYGDDYEYMDEATARSFKAMARNTLKMQKQIDSGAVEQAVNKKLDEVSKKQKLADFTAEMDAYVKTIDPDSDMVQIVNEPAFDTYLRNNRRAKALFIDASKDGSFDKTSKELMREVIDGYLGKAGSKPPPKKNGHPDVKSGSSKPKRRRKSKITQAQINQAYEDLKRPSLRKKAEALLRKAEAEGLDVYK